MPKAVIGSEEYVYFTCKNTLEMHCLAISNSLCSTSGAVYVGLDCEWSVHDGTSSITHFVQIFNYIWKSNIC